MTSNAYEDVGLFQAGASIIDTGGINDYNVLAANIGPHDADIAGARLEAITDPPLI